MNIALTEDSINVVRPMFATVNITQHIHLTGNRIKVQTNQYTAPEIEKFPKDREISRGMQKEQSGRTVESPK